jgi:hypothetical protein
MLAFVKSNVPDLLPLEVIGDFDYFSVEHDTVALNGAIREKDVDPLVSHAAFWKAGETPNPFPVYCSLHHLPGKTAGARSV